MSVFTKNVKPRLSYFDMPGRAEAIRLAFVVSSRDFEDERVPFKDWPAMKQTNVVPSMPFLSFDGCAVPIHGHRSILRLVGKDLGLYPDHAVGAARCDAVMDVCDDWMGTINNAGRGMETAEKEAARLKEVTDPASKASHLFRAVETYIGTNTPYLFGDTLTVADLCIFAIAGAVESGLYDGVPRNTFDSYAKIQTLRRAVANVPEIVSYYDDRLAKNLSVEARYIHARSF